MSCAGRTIFGAQGDKRWLFPWLLSEAIEALPTISSLFLLTCCCFSPALSWAFLVSLFIILLHFSRVLAPFHRSRNCSHELSSLLEPLAAVAAGSLLILIQKTGLRRLWAEMCLKRRCISELESAGESECPSLLELPELVLEDILGRLSGENLCTMARVSRALRARCSGDDLWEPLVKEKWGKVAGAVAYREWQWSLVCNHEIGAGNLRLCNFWRWPFACIWPFSLFVSLGNGRNVTIDSLMAWFGALESGKFWFPAQVYNREHGHVGFVLSCYDAEVSYDRATDTFRARYPPHGPHTIVIEEGVSWDRLRAAPVNTPAHDLYISTGLGDLRPGDHVEVQWRRNKEFPYGWWYGIVGHVDACSRNSSNCLCHLDDTLWLEFNQFAVGSRWRRSSVQRHGHHEEGNEVEGFYGGIRKLHTAEEISTWKQLWPKETLE